MGDTFRLSPEDMLNVGNDFETKAGELEQIMKGLSSSVANLQASWEGAGADQFDADFTACTSAVNKLIDALRERSSALKSASNLATETSNALKKQWS